MKLSNKRVVERANCGDKKAVAVAKLRRIGNYETKAYKFVDVNNIDVDKLKRIHLKSKERLICSEQIENVIKKIKKSDGLLKELKKHDIDVTFDYHATVGDSYYNNKTHNEILTDSISLLYNQNGLYILCDKKQKV